MSEKINKRQNENSADGNFVLPSRMDLLGFIARDGKAGCQGSAREWLGNLRDWFTEMTYRGLITDPETWGRG